MKRAGIFPAAMAFMLCAFGCFEQKENVLYYFNFSSHRIVIRSITGFPYWAACGVLPPCNSDGRPSEASATSYGESLEVPLLFKIVWEEDGIPREAEIRRNAVGIPAKVKKGGMRFSYFGNGRWQVEFSGI